MRMKALGVKLFVGRSVFRPHLLQVDLQLLGDQHGDGCVSALPHLDVRHRQEHLSITVDADKRVRYESVGRFGFAVSKRQTETQHQAAACGRSGP